MKRWLPVIALVLVELLLAWKNIVPGTWLVGWDNTMPELDFDLNFHRILNATWQEYRGLGVADGMAHAANISHWIIVKLLAFVLPVNYVRYGFVFLAHLLGGIGMYWLVRSVLLKKTTRVIGLIAGLFYMLNPFTLQIFYTPLELFLFHYALLPWSLGFALIYLQSGKRSDLGWFGIVNLIGVSQAHVPTVFLVYGLMIGLVALKSWKRGINLLLVVAVVNLFWLMPYVVNVFSTAGDITRAKMNVMSTLETQLRNDAYGDFGSVALMRSFNLDYEDWLGGKEFGLQFEVWRNWTDNALIRAGLWVIFGVMLWGLFILFKDNKLRRRLWPMGLIWLVGLLALGSQIPILGEVYQWVRTSVPYMGQLLRFTFTKFGVMYAFGASVCLAVGVDYLRQKIKAGVLLLVPLLILVSWPAFTGEFLYSKLKLDIPSEYFEVKTYLDSQHSDKRIVYLPLSSYWGWEFNEWNYRGSGFLWQMIKQPMLMRSFDPWSSSNETFYHELSTAFYFCPPKADENQVDACARNVKQVFDKYQVSLALLDESVILPGQNQEIMRYELWKQVLAKLDPDVNFKSGFLSVYDVNHSGSVITAPEKYRQIEAETTYGRFDPYFSGDNAYIEGNGIAYPFSSVSKEDITSLVGYGEDGAVKIKGDVVEEGKLEFPEFSQGDMWRGRIRATLSGEELTVELLPFGQLVVGEQHFPLWLDQRLEVIQLPEVLESVVVQVGDKAKTIERDKPDEIWDIPMTVGQGLSLKVFEGEGQEIKISTPSARLGQVAENRLIRVESNQKFCLGFEQKNYQCLNQGNMLVTLQKGVYWFDALETITELPVITIHQPIAGYEFEATMWGKAKREFEIGAGEITWEMPAAPREAGSWKLEAGSENCDVLKRGRANKSVVENGVLYETEDYGAYCDSWWVNPIGEEGILRLTGENLAGRGIKLSVFSTQENRTLLEQLLSNGGGFDQSYGFLTGLQQGSTFNVETKSFGRIVGKNRLNSAQFYPVSLTWLQKIKIGEETAVNNNLEIIETKKYGTGIYQVRVSGSGLLVLNQGFDRGWVATTKGEHVRVNGWANGWIIPANSEQLTANSADHRQPTTVLLFYWPQLLEWAGLLVLPLGIVWLLKK